MPAGEKNAAAAGQRPGALEIIDKDVTDISVMLTLIDTSRTMLRVDADLSRVGVISPTSSCQVSLGSVRSGGDHGPGED